MNCKTYDVVIVGGGIMGSSTAYYLMKNAPGLRVAVIEMDRTYSRASTTLSMANARIQFSFKPNVQISQYAFEVLENFEQDMEIDGIGPSIRFRREGNLFMVNEENRIAADNALKMQQELGCDIEWWTPEKIRERFPLYNPEGYVGASFGPKDGHLDAYGVLMGYRAKAISMGAEFIHAEVSEITKTGKRATGVRLTSGEDIGCRCCRKLRGCLVFGDCADCRGPSAGSTCQAPDICSRHKGQTGWAPAADIFAFRDVFPNGNRRVDPFGEIFAGRSGGDFLFMG